MRALTLQAIQHQPETIVYRYRRWASALAVLVCAVLSAGPLVIAHTQEMHWFGMALLYWIAFWMGLFGLMTYGVFKARCAPQNWLMSEYRDGLHIKFRSYLNHHFPADDPIVLELPYHEIAGVRAVSERRLRPADRGGRQQSYQRFLEITLKSPIPGEIATAIQAEQQREAPKKKTGPVTHRQKYRHSPLRLADQYSLHIEWQVAPGLKETLKRLQTWVPLLDEVSIERDYTELEGLPREQQEARLRELVAGNDVMGAIIVAKRLFGYDTTAAKRYVESLR